MTPLPGPANSSPRRARPPLGRGIRFAGMRFDDAGNARVIEWLCSRTRDECFAYIVTPNADHIVRLVDHPQWTEMQAAYDDADLCLCDSRVLALLARLKGVRLPTIPGSDLVELFLRGHLPSGRKLLVIGGGEDTAKLLAKQLPGVEIVQHRPPMGLLKNPAAMRQCVATALLTRADYILLAVGSPQQELIAHRLAGHPQGSGTALCIGAAVDYAIGKSSRAPRWMRRLALEWLYRLLADPRRLWRRYLLHSPRIFWIALTR